MSLKLKSGSRKIEGLFGDGKLTTRSVAVKM